MGDLKPISHKQFNKKVKDLKEEIINKLKHLKATVEFKPIYDRRMLVISSQDMEPTKFNSLRKPSKDIGVSYGALRYAYSHLSFEYTAIVTLKYIGISERANLVNFSNYFSHIFSLFYS